MSEIVESFGVRGCRCSVLSLIDVRLKIISSFLLLFTNVAIANVYFSVFLIFNLMVFTILSRVGFERVVRGLIVPSVFGVFVLITQSFWLKQGREIEILGIIVYEAGVSRGVKVFFSVVSGVWLLILTSQTSKPEEFLSGFKKLGIPSFVIDTVIMMYRYIFVLRDEALRIFFAQKVRLGYSNLVNSIRSMGELWGIMLVNSLMRASRVYEAMVSRGFNGKLFYESDSGLNWKQVVGVLVYLLVVVGVGIIIKLYV